MMDQAGKLREIVHSVPTPINRPQFQPRVYSIISGKGGVGKTSLAVNLGISLAKLGQKVLILDADIGMSNANILLGEYVRYDIFDALDQGRSFRDILVRTDHGVDLLSGGSEFFRMEELDPAKQQDILKGLSILEDYDTIIIDNGAGISRQSLAFTILGDEIILVTTPEPTAITDAYRVLKTISLYKIKNSVKVVVNQIQNREGGEEAFEKLRYTASEFLGLDIESTGFIYADTRVGKAVMDQVPYVVKYPTSLAGKGVSEIAGKLLGNQGTEETINAVSRLGNRILRIFG